MAEPSPFGLLEVRRALAEDRAREDVTTHLLGRAAEQRVEARFIAEGSLVAAGLPILTTVFRELDPRAAVRLMVADGSWADAGTTLAIVSGTARALLAGERVALNFVQRLAGVATLTRRAVDAVRGTPAKITHTRKTTPGLRSLELYAVRIGGGVENRATLAAAVLWKDNHWALLGQNSLSLAGALRAVPPGVPVIVEVETDEQLEAALAAGVTHILVDNQPPERVAVWAHRAAGAGAGAGRSVTIQASGGITADTARAYADAGAALIAIGALTHSAPAAPIRCDISDAVLAAVSSAPAPR
ncbi:MAG: carboxylating nicotinate-nucleotide diphosphorylase [Gemmatimonadetes bacterium]|nr:MAG: carboxylating nicotinate-nucleotide diphosphorylase [Gemmatimonadota bacterium]